MLTSATSTIRGSPTISVTEQNLEEKRKPRSTERQQPPPLPPPEPDALAVGQLLGLIILTQETEVQGLVKLPDMVEVVEEEILVVFLCGLLILFGSSNRLFILPQQYGHLLSKVSDVNAHIFQFSLQLVVQSSNSLQFTSPALQLSILLLHIDISVRKEILRLCQPPVQKIEFLCPSPQYSHRDPQ